MAWRGAAREARWRVSEARMHISSAGEELKVADEFALVAQRRGQLFICAQLLQSTH